jgi:hypothetical protein
MIIEGQITQRTRQLFGEGVFGKHNARLLFRRSRGSLEAESLTPLQRTVRLAVAQSGVSTLDFRFRFQSNNRSLVRMPQA